MSAQFRSLPSGMERSFLIVLALTGLVTLTACGPSEPPVMPPLDIGVVEVVVRDQPIAMDMVGETLGSSDIPIRARVEGVVTSMRFVEGRSVEKDQLLYTIDPEPFEAEVVEAQGALAAERTRLVKAKADLDRIKPLAEMRAVSQSELDAAVAQHQAALGALQSAQARVEQATIRLAYTRIHAPISGRIGISEAKVGEFVGIQPNPVVLNFVSQSDPIRVSFSIDERTYLRLAKRLRELQQQTGEASEMGEGLQLTLADGTIHDYRGRVVAADAAVNPKTGTFTFQADFPNPENLVLAGQFARVRAIAEVRPDALLIPSRAVSELQGNFRVFVVNSEGKVEIRPIQVGLIIDNFRIVNAGLKPGERVAVEFMKLQPGMTVNPVLRKLNEDGTLEDNPSAAPPAATTSADSGDQKES